MNYIEVEKQLQGRNKLSRKIANNTYLIRHDNYLALRYHSTEVVKFYPDNSIVLDNGGWFTSTTKERINMAIGNKLYQSKGVWYIGNLRYQNGMKIQGNKITGYAKDNLRADKQLKAKVKAYATKCADAIPLDIPSGGDCWYCYMHTDNGQSLGDASHDTSHLDEHIKESYIVPSLVYNALKQYGNTDFILSLVFNNPEKHMLDIAKQRVYKSVYRYILQRKGYAI